MVKIFLICQRDYPKEAYTTPELAEQAREKLDKEYMERYERERGWASRPNWSGFRVEIIELKDEVT